MNEEKTSQNSKPSKLSRLAEAGPVAVRRWGRFVGLRYGRTLGRILARRKIRREAKKNEKALIAAHEAVLNAYRGAEKLKLTHSMVVHRVSLFLLTANRDIAAIKVDLLTANNWWLRKLLARNVALMMYELDISKVTGNQFRAAINYFSPPKTFQNELFENIDRLRKVQVQLKEEFSELRNNTIAHRDADAMRQYRLIRNIDEMALVNRAADFFKAAEPVIGNLTQLTLITGDMRHLLNQYIGKKLFKKKR